MRRSREETARTRARIVEKAAVLFREKGIEGVGLADLMQDAGLTHGGFYRHFASRDELVSEACSLAFMESVQRMTGRAAADPDHGLEKIVNAFLCESHVANPGRGCGVAALGGDVFRRDERTRDAFTKGVTALIALLASLQPGRTAVKRREQAMVAYASMLGALIMARGVDDPALRRSILETVRRAILDRDH
jgi:TetR/AcrR family transcriptional repressor of nem operon